MKKQAERGTHGINRKRIPSKTNHEGKNGKWQRKKQGMQYFLDLIIKSGNKYEIQNCIENTDFNVLDEYKKYLHQKIKKGLLYFTHQPI